MRAATEIPPSAGAPERPVRLIWLVALLGFVACQAPLFAGDQIFTHDAVSSGSWGRPSVELADDPVRLDETLEAVEIEALLLQHTHEALDDAIALRLADVGPRDRHP